MKDTEIIHWHSMLYKYLNLWARITIESKMVSILYLFLINELFQGDLNLWSNLSICAAEASTYDLILVSSLK